MSLRARDNPFAVDRIHAIDYEPLGWTWDELLQKLASAHWRGAIVGPHGSGKTTLLQTLVPLLRDRGMATLSIRLNRQKRTPRLDEWAAIASIESNTIVMLDGYEQLSRWNRRRLDRLARHALGLIVTAHDDPALPVLIRCQSDPFILRDITARLAGNQALDDIDPESLLTAHHGNMRHALRELYDRHAMRSAPQTPTCIGTASQSTSPLT